MRNIFFTRYKKSVSRYLVSYYFDKRQTVRRFSETHRQTASRYKLKNRRDLAVTIGFIRYPFINKHRLIKFESLTWASRICSVPARNCLCRIFRNSAFWRRDRKIGGWAWLFPFSLSLMKMWQEDSSTEPFLTSLSIQYQKVWLYIPNWL